jgi:tRNA dimethylallyltransferase
MKKFAVAIFGPTGVGKTALSLGLAEKNGEVISVDSRQVYKYMDIGTAKPSSQDLQRVKHHLIDIITPDITYAAGEFKRNSELLMDDITCRGKIPFLVGGTGLYFKSLMYGMAEIPAIDQEIRDRLSAKWNKIGQNRMYNLLQRIDPSYAGKIHANDSQRTLRALEVYLGTKKRLSEYITSNNRRNDFAFINIGIHLERGVLYDRINTRVDLMIKDGLVDEVKSLLEAGYDGNDPGMQGIGYKEISSFLKDETSLEDAVTEMKQKSRNYAKRQITWFKIMPDTKWFAPDDIKGVREYIELSLN